MKSQKSRQPRAELRVESVEDDGWTWCYVQPEDGVEFYSNETYAAADDAKDWARRAYPDVPFAEDKREDEGEDEKEDGNEGEKEDGEG